MTKRQKAALLREFTTAELKAEVRKRERKSKSYQRDVLDGMLDTLNEKQIRAICKRLVVGRVTSAVPAIEAKNCIDCGGDGVMRADESGWLCTPCANRRVNSPRNIALTEADQEMTEHLEAGGKLS
jgi:hypothetical protein